MDLTRKLGAGANYSVEVAVYTSLLSNTRVGPTMSDSVALFNSAHGNLAGSGAAPSQTTLEAAVAAMMEQSGTGQDSSSVALGVAPKFWFAKPAVAMAIEKIIGSDYAGSDARRDPQVQAIANTTVIKVPCMTALGVSNDWYAAADQALAPSYEVGFLRGNRTPRIQIQNVPTVDGTTVVVDLDYAAFPTGGWQGIYRNPGA